MQYRKEMLRRAAAFISALSFLSAGNVNVFTAVAETTSAASTADTTETVASDEAEQTYQLQIRVNGSGISDDRKKEILSRFRNSEGAKQSSLQIYDLKEDNNDLRLECGYKCKPSLADSKRSEIFTKLADECSDKYKLWDELYSVSFDKNSGNIKADVYYRIEGTDEFFEGSGSQRFNGFETFGDECFIKRETLIRPRNFNLKKGYYAENSEDYYVDRKITAESVSGGKEGRIGCYDDSGNFHTMLSIKRTELTVSFDCNSVWVNLDKDGFGLTQDQKLTIPWLDIIDTDIIVHPVRNKDVDSCIIKEMPSADGQNVFDFSADGKARVNIRSLIQSQFAEDGKAEFTKDAQYKATITGIHGHNYASVTYESGDTEEWDMKMENGSFNIPYIIHKNGKTWYLSGYKYEYDTMEDSSIHERSFAECLVSELKNGKSSLTVPYTKHNPESDRDYTLKAGDNGELIDLIYSVAAMDDGEKSDEIMSNMAASSGEDFRAGIRNENVLDCSAAESYSFSLPSYYKGKSFVYTDDKGNSLLKSVETVTDEETGKEQYILSIDGDSVNDGEEYHPAYYKFILMTEGNSPCNMKPFIMYIDRSEPRLGVFTDKYLKTDGWSDKNSFVFDITAGDQASELDGKGLDENDTDEINNDLALGSISSVRVGSEVISRPEGGWKKNEYVDGKSKDGTYNVRLNVVEGAENKLFFRAEVSILGDRKGFSQKLAVSVTDNAGRKSETKEMSVKIDIGMPKAAVIDADKIEDDTLAGSKLTVSADLSDVYGNAPYSGISKVVYRFERTLDRNSFTNEYKKEFGAAELKKSAVFDFTGRDQKGFIIVEVTDNAGNIADYYYCSDKNMGYVTTDIEKAAEIIIDSSTPPLPVIHEEALLPDARENDKIWFKDYHRIRFSAADENKTNSGLKTIGIVFGEKERSLDLSKLGFSSARAAELSLADGDFYVDIKPSPTDNTHFIPTLKNEKNSSVNIELFDDPLPLDEDGKLKIGFYSIDKAGNRCQRENNVERISETEYYVDNNAPSAAEVFARGSSENEDTIRIRKYGTFANRSIEIEVPVWDKKNAPSSGLKKAELTYKTKGRDHTASTDVFADGKAVFTIPAEGVDENTFISGNLFIKVTDNVGNESELIGLASTEKSKLLVFDNIKPVLSEKAVITGDAPYTDANNDVWFKGDASISFTASDEGAGLAGVKINVDSGKFITDDPLENDFTGESTPVEERSFTLKTAPDSDGEYRITVDADDNSGNTSSAEYRVFKDVKPPRIASFRFEQASRSFDDNMVDPEARDRFSHFANHTIPMIVRITDNDSSSSGISKVIIELRSTDGKTEKHEFVPNETNYVDGNRVVDIKMDISEGFKGDIRAWAYDNVGNVSEIAAPNGFISENGTTNESHAELKIDLDKTDKKDAEGNDLFNKDVTAKLTVSDTFSGIQQIQWMTSEMEDWETVDIDMDGRIVGDGKGWTVSESSRERNIALKASCELTVKTDANNNFIKLKVIDNTGNTKEIEKIFSIDKQIPVIDVNGIEAKQGVVYYNSRQSAHITIYERNYDAPMVNGVADTAFKEENGTPKLSDKHKYTKDIEFISDGRYELNIDDTDLAGNAAVPFRSGVFVIDTTSPKASVNVRKLDGTVVKAGDKTYIETDASASVTVDEVNFSPDSINILINGERYVPSAWSEGTSHTANIPSSYFSADGNYTITVSGKDLAGNTLRSVSASFTVDKKEPEIKISGVTNANKGEVAPVVNITDDNLSAQDVKVYKNGELLNVNYENDGEIAKYDVNKKGNFIVGRWDTESSDNSIKKKLVFDDFPKEETYDGSYKIEVESLDKAENSKSDTMEFSVNRFGSVFTVENIGSIDGKYLNIAPEIIIKERNVDKHKSDSDVVIIIDKGSNTVKLTKDLYTVSEPVKLEDGSGYEYTYTIDASNFNQDLNYNITIQSEDEAGNKNVSTGRGAELSFTVDTHKPEFKCDELVDRAEFKESQKEFRLNVNEKLAHIKITTGNDVVLFEDDGSNADNSYSFSVAAMNASRDITVEMTDLAGNKTSKTFKDLLITENVALFVMHKTWAKAAGIASAAGVGVIAAFFAIRKRRRGY